MKTFSGLGSHGGALAVTRSGSLGRSPRPTSAIVFAPILAHPCRTRVGSTIGGSSLPEEYLNWVAWQVPEVLLGGHSSQEPALNDSRFASRRPWGWILYTP